VREFAGGELVVRPDATGLNDWLGDSIRPQADPAGSSLFVLNLSDLGVVEITADGRFVRRFGRPDPGPGGLQGPGAYVVDPEGVFVLDGVRGRVLHFSRDGAFVEETVTPSLYWDIAPGEDRTLVAFPAGSAPFVRYEIRTHRFTEPFGDFGEFRGRCVWCRVIAAGGGELLVLYGARPELFLVDASSGAVLWKTAFDNVPILREWRREETEIMGATDPGRGKIYMTDIAMGPDRTVFINVLPGTGRGHPTEVWRYRLPDADEADPGEGSLLGRFQHSSDWSSWYHAVSNGSLVSIDSGSGAIMRFELPK